jgi:adenylate cyclase
MAKNYGVDILISENTNKKVKGVLLTRMLDKIIVKGKTKGVLIYELLGVKKEANAKLIEYVKAYEDGLEKYFKKKWDEAVISFKNALKYNAADKASKVLIDRCKYYKKNPIDGKWDGSFAYLNK